MKIFKFSFTRLFYFYFLLLSLILNANPSLADQIHRLKGVGYAPEFPVTISTTCSLNQLRKRPTITLHCEPPGETFFFPSSSHLPLLHLLEGRLAGELEPFPILAGLEESYAYKMALAGAFFTNYEYFQEMGALRGSSLQEAFINLCQDVYQIQELKPVTPDRYWKRDPVKKGLFEKSQAILRDSCRPDNVEANDLYLEESQILFSWVKEIVRESSVFLQKKNRARSGGLFLPRDFPTLMKTASTPGPGGEKARELVMGPLRNVVFVNNIMQQICPLAQEKKNLVVQVGEAHCPTIKVLLKSLDPRLKVHIRPLGSAFHFVMGEGGRHLGDLSPACHPELGREETLKNLRPIRVPPFLEKSKVLKEEITVLKHLLDLQKALKKYEEKSQLKEELKKLQAEMDALNKEKALGFSEPLTEGEKSLDFSPDDPKGK